MVSEKAVQLLNNHLTHAQKYIVGHKKEFSAFRNIYRKFIKKENYDPAFEYTKEIIKRLERDKVSQTVALEITEALTPEMQSMKKEIIKMAIPLIIGFIAMITFTLLFSFTRPFDLSNSFVTYYGIGIIISTLVFGFGVYLRKKVTLNTLSKSMVFQAATAYGAAKMQGQGSFGAFRILDEMKHKQGKEMQIRVMQPKVVHKR